MKFLELSEEAKIKAVNQFIETEKLRTNTDNPIIEVIEKHIGAKLKQHGLEFKSFIVDLQKETVQLVDMESPNRFINQTLKGDLEKIYRTAIFMKRPQIEMEIKSEITQDKVVSVIAGENPMGNFMFNSSSDNYYRTIKEEIKFVSDYDKDEFVSAKYGFMILFEENVDYKKQCTIEFTDELLKDLIEVINQYVPAIEEAINKELKELGEYIIGLYKEAQLGESVYSYYKRLLEVDSEFKYNKYQFDENGKLLNND